MTGWQHIETIPDDVMEALLYGELDGDISGRFGYKSRVVGKRDRLGGPWAVDTDTYGVDIIATHWMPLPLPPPPTKERSWEAVPEAKDQPNDSTSAISTRDLKWFTRFTGK